mgnify:CR=1 FL=1
MTDKKHKKIREEIAEIFSEWDCNSTPDILKVSWVDACSDRGDLSYKEVKERNLAHALTIGYLVNEKEDSITLCGFLFPDQNCDMLDTNPSNQTCFKEIHIIPKFQIKAIMVLETNWEKTKKYQNDKKDLALKHLGNV